MVVPAPCYLQVAGGVSNMDSTRQSKTSRMSPVATSIPAPLRKTEQFNDREIQAY